MKTWLVWLVCEEEEEVRYTWLGALVGLLTLGGLCYILETLLYLEDLDYGALGLDLLVYIGLMTLEDLDYGALALG